MSSLDHDSLRVIGRDPLKRGGDIELDIKSDRQHQGIMHAMHRLGIDDFDELARLGLEVPETQGIVAVGAYGNL